MRNVLIIPPRSAAEALELAREAEGFGLSVVAEEFMSEVERLTREELERSANALLVGCYYLPGNRNVH